MLIQLSPLTRKTMAFTRSTSLGRHVRLDDWLSFHRDCLLETLYQMRDSGGDDNGLTLKQIASITGLDESSAYELVQSMKAQPKLIKMTLAIPFLVVITARGIRWVEESPRPPGVD